MIKLLFVVFLNLILYFIVLSNSVLAQSCSGVPISGSYTVSSSCSFANTIDGVDAGSGTSNTASITINSGVTLTISSGQTVAFGSLTPNGTIVITKTPSGGQLRKVPLWMTDADADGYASSTTQIAQATTPTDGRRRNLMTSITSIDCNNSSANVYQNVASTATDADQDGYYIGASDTNCVGNSSVVSGRTYYVATSGSSTWLATAGALGSSDCNDSSATTWQNLTCYGGADADADTYRVGAAESVCSGSACPSGYSSSQDCCDSDANAKPGQTSYFTTARTTCGGFDYDCGGTETKDPAIDCQAVGNWGSTPCPATDPHSGYVTSVAVPACGVSGDWIRVYTHSLSNCSIPIGTLNTLSTSCSNLLSSYTRSSSLNNITQTMGCR